MPAGFTLHQAVSEFNSHSDSTLQVGTSLVLGQSEAADQLQQMIDDYHKRMAVDIEAWKENKQAATKLELRNRILEYGRLMAQQRREAAAAATQTKPAQSTGCCLALNGDYDSVMAS